MSDETGPARDAPPQIEGPIARPPVSPKVQRKNSGELVPRDKTPQWRPGDPVTIVEDMKDR
jgi:hypothetical protein